MTITRYAAPPITEAVVEIKFTDRLNAPTYAKIIDRFSRKYEASAAEQLFEINIDLVTGTPHVQNKRPVQRFASPDQADIFIVKDDSLSWSRLAPYEGWESLIDRVLRDLDQVVKITKHRRVERLGVRYINRIDVPMPSGDVCWYEHFLAVHLQLPPIIDPLDAYGWRVERIYRDLSLNAVVQSGTMQPELPETAAFSLDIDVSATLDLPSTQADIAKRLEAMRNLKNEIFEQSITDRARETFQ